MEVASLPLLHGLLTILRHSVLDAFFLHEDGQDRLVDGVVCEGRRQKESEALRRIGRTFNDQNADRRHGWRGALECVGPASALGTRHDRGGRHTTALTHTHG